MKRVLAVALMGQVSCALCASGFASAKTTDVPSSCSTRFTVVTRDTLSNVEQGLSAKDMEWFQKKLAKKYSDVCYAKLSSAPAIFFYITETPDTFYGTRVVNNTSTASNPVSATITDQEGNTARVNGTVQTTSTSSTVIPYSFAYAIYTLSVERMGSDGKFNVLHTFQQRGIYNTLYGIPLGGRGHHPTHAVIEDAVKWISSGGLKDQSEPILREKAPLPSATSVALVLPPNEATGDAEAQHSLGLSYYYGQGVTQDYTKAAEWYRKAAAQGDVAGQTDLGTMYYFGKGVPQDYAQAAEWYRKAAEQGYAQAQYNLGMMYAIGQGVEADRAEATDWTLKAAEQGYAAAQDSAGSMYENGGKGVPQDDAQAAIWYLKAAHQGNADAQFNVAAMNEFGKGVPQNSDQAVEWYGKAAEQGNAEAKYNLGAMFYKGLGVPQNFSEAYFWFDLAAADNVYGIKSEEVVNVRDEAASHLSLSDLSEVQQKVQKWSEAYLSPVR